MPGTTAAETVTFGKTAVGEVPKVLATAATALVSKGYGALWRTRKRIQKDCRRLGMPGRTANARVPARCRMLPGTADQDGR